MQWALISTNPTNLFDSESLTSEILYGNRFSLGTTWVLLPNLGYVWIFQIFICPDGIRPTELRANILTSSPELYVQPIVLLDSAQCQCNRTRMYCCSSLLNCGWLNRVVALYWSDVPNSEWAVRLVELVSKRCRQSKKCGSCLNKGTNIPFPMLIGWYNRISSSWLVTNAV
jgi:hypothetical protein